MPHTVELRGHPASPGVFCGPLVTVDAEQPVTRAGGSPDDERAALKTSIAQAIEELTRLAEQVDEESADIIGFQIAMLEDPELSQPAGDEIDCGTPADIAWKTAVEVQVADYEASDDEYFRARAADLRDLRDRVMRHLTGLGKSRLPGGAVLVGDDVTPTRFLETDWSGGGGIVLTGGSATSHVAMLARSRGVPMVIGVSGCKIAGHREALIDGASGEVTLSPDADALLRFEALSRQAEEAKKTDAEFAAKPARTADGEPVAVMINVASADELDAIDVATCDGIGLMRSEFLFHDGAALPGEDIQFTVYRRLLEWAEGRPVTIRTLDAGGDKPIAGLTVDGEANTFLGVRGIRLSFAREDVFRTQLRALARAAPHGTLKVMWPMITHPDELDRAAAIFDEELASLKAAGIECARPQLGMMVEVPAPAIAPDLFDAAEFFSIGSNDLTQYVAAAARDNVAVMALAEGVRPVIERLVAGLVKYGHARGIEVSICGDLAGDESAVNQLLKAGLRSLSVAPAVLGRIKAAVASVRLEA